MAIYKTKIIGKQEVAQGTIEVALKKPKDFDFKPGQYIQISTPLKYADTKGDYRVFSLASSPLEDNLKIAFRYTGSGFKHSLKDLPLGSGLKIEGPHGFFGLPEVSRRPFVLIAGGIGITPFMSMLRSKDKTGFGYNVKLLYANRNPQSAAYLDELQEISKTNKFFALKNIFGRIDENFIKQNVEYIYKSKWCIAGPPGMVDEMKNVLYLLGIDEAEIFTEEYVGY